MQKSIFLLIATVAVPGCADNPSPQPRVTEAPNPATDSDSAGLVRESDDQVVAAEPDERQVPHPESDLNRAVEFPNELLFVLDGATALNPDETVFLGEDRQRVFLKTEVACPDCILEMLLVPRGNREHETILRIDAPPFLIHTALLATNAAPGRPAVFGPEFQPATGTELAINVHWLDKTGSRQSAPVQSWIRKNIHRYFAAPLETKPEEITFPQMELRYDPYNKEILWFGPMTESQRESLLALSDQPEYRKAIRGFFTESQFEPINSRFVFAGSGFLQDEETGEEVYLAESGHVICVANFPDAMIDIAEESTNSDGAQVYEAWTERIPPQDTPVILEIIPQPAAPQTSSPEEAEAPTATDQSESPDE